jgi:hypothetical protein
MDEASLRPLVSIQIFYILYYYYYYMGVQGVLKNEKLWIIVKGKRSDLSLRLGFQALFA